MLSSGAYLLSTGFALTLPVADYYTFDGTRIEGQPVKPEVEVKSDKALVKALEMIESQ
jgi:C-terminal processing protease CtpA/Prc